MLCLLGTPALRVDARLEPLHLRPKALAVLAQVALRGPVPRDELAALIFPDAADPRAALRWQLAHLRARLPSAVDLGSVTTPGSVVCDLPLDATTFRAGAEQILRRGVRPDDAAVLALYRGDLCAGLTVSASAEFDNWLYIEQEGLRRAFRQAAIAFARWALGNEETDALAIAAASLARLVAVDPYLEEGHILLVEVYEALGSGPAATAAYARYRRILREELQVAPAPALARRYESTPPVGPVLARDSLVPLDDLTLHTVEWPGPEPTILAIHGSGMSAYSLTALAERLSPEVRVIALDLRGHGLSDKPAHGYEIARHAQDIRALIKALDLQRPVLLGFSMGGAVAAVAAAAGETGGLILLDGVVGRLAFTENAATAIGEHAAAKITPAGGRYGGFAEYLAHARRRYSSEAERLLERTVRYELARLPDGSYRRRDIRQALEKTWASLLVTDTLGALAAVACPVLIVQATRPWIGGRPYLDYDAIDEQVRAAPHAWRFVAHQSDHPALARDPEPGLIEVITRFVRTVDHAPRRDPRATPT